jgi:hypothetical protein
MSANAASEDPFCACGHAAWWHDYKTDACEALVTVGNERRLCGCEKYRSQRMQSQEAERYADDD